MVVGLLFSLLPTTVFAIEEEEDCGRQMWFPEENEDTDPGWANYIMYRSTTGESPYSAINYIPVTGNTTVLWRSDEAAATSVTFCDGNGDDKGWDGKIMLDAKSYNLSGVTVELGYLDGFPPSGFHTAGGTTLAYQGGSHVAEYQIALTGFTVPQGAYLALRLINNTSQTIGVGTGETHNWLKAECSPPCYPTPEIPTIVLFATGLVCLGGYLALRRKRAKAASL